MKTSIASVTACVLMAGAILTATAQVPSVGDAVQDPSKIGAMLDGSANKVESLKQAVTAATKLPEDPADRLQRIADVIANGLNAIGMAEQPAALAAMVCSIPFDLLPGTVDALIPGMRTRTAAMEMADFNDYVAKAIQAVADQGLDKDETDIYTAFVIVLLSKDPETPENMPAVVDTAIGFVPEGSRETVRTYVDNILGGDLAPVFGTEGAAEVVPLPHADDYPYGIPEVPGAPVNDPEILVDNDLDHPVIATGDTPAPGKPGKPSKPDKPKPPKPEPYAGQWH